MSLIWPEKKGDGDDIWATLMSPMWEHDALLGFKKLGFRCKKDTTFAVAEEILRP